jgi:hypothetical protein
MHSHYIRALQDLPFGEVILLQFDGVERLIYIL